MGIQRFFSAILLLTPAAIAQQYTISTFAGGAPPSVPTYLSMVINTQGLSLDDQGRLYVSANDCVFRLDPSGALARIAGNAIPGYSGDGAPATNAQLHDPEGLAVDRGGNLYIADNQNSRVRRVTPDGIITTIAGGGQSGDGGPAVNARVNPFSLAVDNAGNLFVREAGRIRKVAPTGIITTVAGTGIPGFSGDGGLATSARLAGGGIAVDSAGNLFIADETNNRVRKVSTDGIITTVAGNGASYFGPPMGDGGPAASAPLNTPAAVAIDALGNLYVAENLNNTIRKISISGIITTIAGTGEQGNSGDGAPAATATLWWPTDMTMDSSGNLFVLDSQNARVRKISSDGIITTALSADPTASEGDGGPATAAFLGVPSGVAADGRGNVFVASLGRIRRVSKDGIITTVPGSGGAGALALDSAGNLYITNGERIQKLSPGGILTTVAGNGSFGFSGDGGPATAAQLWNATAVAVDGAGNIFIADTFNYRVRRVALDGTITTVAGGGSRVFEDGGTRPATQVALTNPTGVAVDGSGNLFIADRYLRKVSPSGIMSTPGGDGTIACNSCVPASAGIAADAAGNVFVVGGPVLKLAANGTVSAVGPSASGPGIAVDSSGNVYVDDTMNGTYGFIRVLRPTTDVQPLLFVSAVVDAASQRTDLLSPGKIVVIYGAGLGPAQLTQNQVSNGRFGTQLGGTSVSFNGIAAPILYTSASQVAVIVPYAASGTTAEVKVSYQGQTSLAFNVVIAPSAVNLFTANQTGAGQAAAINAVDGTVNTAANPITVGGYLSLYATGEGATTPVGQDGLLVSSQLTHPNLPVSATVGGIPATVQYGGGAPGLVSGLMQVNLQIPNGVQPGGYVPVQLQVGDTVSDPGVWIAVSGN
jgi:uncharacterized protein (TIGR03437 family)